MLLRIISRSLPIFAIPVMIIIVTVMALGQFIRGDIVLGPGQSFHQNLGPTITNHTGNTIDIYSRNLEGFIANLNCQVRLNLSEAEYQLPVTLDEGQTFTVYGQTTQDFVIGLITACGGYNIIAQRIVSTVSEIDLPTLSTEATFSEAIRNAEATAIRHWAQLSGLSYDAYASLVQHHNHPPISHEAYRTVFFLDYYMAARIWGLPLAVNG